MTRPRRVAAPLAREVRLLLTATLGSWPKVLQLGFLTVVATVLVALLLLGSVLAAGGARSWLGGTLKPLLSQITETRTPSH